MIAANERPAGDTSFAAARPADGPQFVTKHGEEIAVVIDIAEYLRLRGGEEDFKAFLRAAPDVDLETSRSSQPSRFLDLDEGE